MTRTPSQTIGPFFAVALGRDDSGSAVRVAGTVYDGEGAPVNDAYVELWDGRRLARSPTDHAGRYEMSIERPEGPYIAVAVFARGLLQRLATRMYLSDPGDPRLAPLRVHEEDGALRFDIHLQGERETVFLAL